VAATDADLLVRPPNLLFPTGAGPRGICRDMAQGETVCGCMGVTQGTDHWRIHDKGVKHAGTAQRVYSRFHGARKLHRFARSCCAPSRPISRKETKKLLCKCVPLSSENLATIIHSSTRLQSVAGGCWISRTALRGLQPRELWWTSLAATGDRCDDAFGAELFRLLLEIGRDGAAAPGNRRAASAAVKREYTLELCQRVEPYVDAPISVPLVTPMIRTPFRPAPCRRQIRRVGRPVGEEQVARRTSRSASVRSTHVSIAVTGLAHQQTP